MDAQGLGRTHPLTPTRRLKQHTHAYNPYLPHGAVVNSCYHQAACAKHGTAVPGRPTHPRSEPAALPAHHTPMTFHQIGPTSSQMAMWTTPRTSPVRHHAPSSTYPDPKYKGAGPLP